MGVRARACAAALRTASERARAAGTASPRGALGSREGPAAATSRYCGSRGFCLFGGACSFSKCPAQQNPAPATAM